MKATKNQSIQVQDITKKLENTIVQIEKAMVKIQEGVEKQNEVIVETTKQITQDYLNSYKEDFEEKMNNDKNF